MSVQTQNTNLNPYSGTPIKNLEYIQNKALVIAPTEITKNGLLDTDLMLDTAGFITMYLYKKIVTGEVKEPTTDQFKLIKTISDLESIGINSETLITTFDIPVIFKYNKDTGTRTIEKVQVEQLPSDYIDFTIDETIVNFSSDGFFCVCKVQKIQKPLTTAFNDVINDEFLFMIPSEECRELIEPIEFDSASLDNKVINIKKYGSIGDNKQGYRIHPVINISDHVNAEESFTPKYYLGTKYQRNLMEILSHSIKSKRFISNLKDMYLVDDICINTLEKINILLETDQMIKFTERLYNLGTPLREKLNADVILEYLSTPVSGSSDNDLVATLKASLIEDYNFTQDEIDNLNNNLNTFKSRARISLATPTINNDKFKFNLPKVFIDGNKSKIEKKNLLIFGTNSGFNKFNIPGYIAPYSNISKRGQTEVLKVNDLFVDLPADSALKKEIGNNVVGLSHNSDTDLYMYFTENNNVFISGRIAWNSNYEEDTVIYSALQLDLSNVTSESKIKMVDCSERTMLILYENGDLYACGSSAYGVIPVTSMVPILIKQNIKHISAGINQFAILDTNNDLYTIGDNYYGNFNTGNSTDKTTWFKSASNVKSYSFCTSTLAVVYNDDTLRMCGGRYANFQSSDEVKTLTKITIPAKVKKIISRTEYTIILFENNSIRCSGYSDTVWTGNLTNNPRINVNPGFTATDIYGGHTQGMMYVSNNKLYGVPKLVISGNIAGNYGYTDLNSYFGNIQDIKDIKMYESSIKIIKNDKNLYSIGRNFSGIFGNGSGSDVTYSTLQQTNPRKFLTDSFLDILSNYKHQIPFTYIPLSTDIKDINDKPVFENLDNITGFEPTDIVIDIPNVL